MTERNSGKKPLRPQAFSYRKPEPRAGDTRELVKLCQTPGMRGAVHVVRQGGGENLHSHPNVDGFWMVVSGQVAFYGEGDISFGEFGPMEGMLIPSGNRYRFESVGDGDAELLQVLRTSAVEGFDREDYEPPIVEKDDIPVHLGHRRLKPRVK